MAEQDEFFRIAVRAIGLFTSRCNFSTEKIRAIVGHAMPITGKRKDMGVDGGHCTIARNTLLDKPGTNRRLVVAFALSAKSH
jgi:hypothetical protein